MKALSSTTRPYLSRFVYGSTLLLTGLAFVLSSHPVLAQINYSTPGLYTYTVPAGGPYQIRITARGGDGGGTQYNRAVNDPLYTSGGIGASVGETFTLLTGDVLTLIVGQGGGSYLIPDAIPSNGGGGGGSAVVLTRNGTRSLLAAAGGGGGGGSMVPPNGQALFAVGGGGGGQGLGPSTGGGGGVPGGGGFYVTDYSGSGGGGGLAGPGGNGKAAAPDKDDPGGGGGGRASLTAVSPGGTYSVYPRGYGGSGFGGGGAIGGFGNGTLPAAAGGGGGGYGGGNGGAVIMDQRNRILGISSATGGYSYVSPTGSATAVTPGENGLGTNQNGEVILFFSNNTATAAFTTTNQSVCLNSSTTLKGTVSAVGSWTVVLSDGTVGTGSGTTFSIPVSPVTSTTYTIQSLIDQRGLAPTNNLTSKATVAVNPLPTVSLTSNGPLTCKPYSATLTATGTGSSYTFTQGNTILPGDPASNSRAISSPGAYTVRVSGIGSCTNSASTTVNQVVVPPVLFISTPNGTQLSCSQPYVQILAYENPGTANPITSFTYTNGNTLLPGDPYNRSQFVTIPGVYTVRVTGANSCTNAANVTITQLQQTPPTVSLTNNGPLTCAKPGVTLTATGTGTTYVFTGGGTTLAGPPSSNTRVVSSPGTYTVVVSDANGCTNSATTTVTSAMTLTATASSSTALVGSSVSLSGAGGDSYQWLAPTGARLSSPATAPLVSATLTASGLQTFTLIVTQNACSQTLTVGVTAIELPDLTVSLYARPSTLYGTSPLTLVGDVSELNGVATTGRVSVRISMDKRLPLSFDPTASSVGGRLVNNGGWTFSGPSGGFYTLTSNEGIGAGGVLSFGLSGLLSPDGTTGLLSISSVVVALDFVEAKLTNNTDAEKIDYFQQ